MHFKKSHLLCALIWLADFVAARSVNAALSDCAPLGAVLPAPVAPSSNEVVQGTAHAIVSELDKLASSLEASSLSVAIQSINEQSPFLAFSSTPKHLAPGGAANVTLDTSFRIASISKVFTVLAILQLGIPLSDPITKYLPQLLDIGKGNETQNVINTPQWNEITIEALASQQSGIATQFGYDLYNYEGNLTQFGLPALPVTASSQCYGYPKDLPPCTEQNFFERFYLDSPIYPPYTTAAYSNIAYDLLGLVIEAVTNTTYTQYLQQNIFNPLGLTHTSTTKPRDSDGFVVQGWDVDLGFEVPTGGLYTSTSDLLALGTAILSSTLLDPATTRAWLKPHAHTASLGVSVGQPWEIARSNNITADRRLIDLYTKTGGLFDYNTVLVLLPDYNISMAIMFAGPETSSNALLGVASQIIEAIVPAIEAAGKAEAAARYAGTYRSNNSVVKLDLDEGPGLLITEFHSHGKDILQTYVNITLDAASGTFGAPLTSVRLYPTGLETSSQQAWRAVYSSSTPGEVEEADRELFFLQGACESWATIGNVLYGLTGLDDFVFEIGRSGHASAISPRAFRETLLYQH